MTMIEVKTSELIGAALDWAVASSINWVEPFYGVGRIWQDESGDLFMDTPDPDEPEDVTKPEHFNHMETWSPSRFWSQCGPLIDKFCSRLSSNGDRSGPDPETGNHYDDPSPWSACAGFTAGYGQGKTALIAACRAIVAARLGDTISVPAELVQS